MTSPRISRRGFLGAAMAAGVVLVADPTPIVAHAAAGTSRSAPAGSACWRRSAAGSPSATPPA